MDCTACRRSGRKAEGQGQRIPWSWAEELMWELWPLSITAVSPKAGGVGERPQEQLGAVAVPEGLLRSHSQHLLAGCVENTVVRVCPTALSCSSCREQHPTTERGSFPGHRNTSGLEQGKRRSKQVGT